jgi:transcriptional regulator with XRE-family HTH domain
MQPSFISLQRQIADRLREHRLARGWSRANLAERAAVSAETLRAFERTGQISLPRLIRLCVALGLERELELLFSAPPPPRSLDELPLLAAKRQRGR